jgi:sirohydrochlorin cobaltochelatase
MKTMIVLAMHGMPPSDFPKKELAEFFRLNSLVEQPGNSANQDIRNQFSILENKLKNWPRNKENDPFQYSSLELAAKLQEISGYEVLVGYNEFCSPDLNETLLQAARENAGKIIIITTMMTGGGKHSERDIPRIIKEFNGLHPEIEVIFAWPFKTEQIAQFLSEHIAQFSRNPE